MSISLDFTNSCLKVGSSASAVSVLTHVYQVQEVDETDMQGAVGKRGRIDSSASLSVGFLSGELVDCFSDIGILTINFQMLKGGKIVLLYAKRWMRRAELSAFSPAC